VTPPSESLLPTTINGLDSECGNVALAHLLPDAKRVGAIRVGSWHAWRLTERPDYFRFYESSTCRLPSRRVRSAISALSPRIDVVWETRAFRLQNMSQPQFDCVSVDRVVPGERDFPVASADAREAYAIVSAPSEPNGCPGLVAQRTIHIGNPAAGVQL